MQWYTGRKSEFNIETEGLETEEIFANILGKVTTHKLLAAIIESTGTIRASIVHGWTEKFCIV